MLRGAVSTVARRRHRIFADATRDAQQRHRGLHALAAAGGPGTNHALWRQPTQPTTHLVAGGWSPVGDDTVSLQFLLLQTRPLSTGGDPLRGEKGDDPVDSTSSPSSKIEETVKRLRKKQEEKLRELARVEDLKKEVQSVIDRDKEEAERKEKEEEGSAVSTEVRKKSLWVRFKDEVKHYYSGFKLLFLDIRVTSKILFKVAKGNTLTRRENRWVEVHLSAFGLHVHGDLYGLPDEQTSSLKYRMYDP